MSIERFNPNTKPPTRRKRAKPFTPDQKRKQRVQAVLLCQEAATEAGRRIADRMAKTWTDCNCDELLSETAATQPDLIG